MNERRKPLSCACCGSDAGKWKQFSNQDAGWGLCRKCADMLTDDSTGRPRMSHAELRRVYGVPGVNFEAQTVKTSHSKGDDPMMVWDCMTNVNPNGKV